MKNLITSSKTAKIRASGAFVSLNIENKLKVKYHIYVNIKQEISSGLSEKWGLYYNCYSMLNMFGMHIVYKI